MHCMLGQPANRTSSCYFVLLVQVQYDIAFVPVKHSVYVCNRKYRSLVLFFSLGETEEQRVLLAGGRLCSSLECNKG